MPSDICCLGARAGCDRLFLPIHMIVLRPMQNGERNDNIREKVPSKFDETEERESKMASAVPFMHTLPKHHDDENKCQAIRSQSNPSTSTDALKCKRIN